MTFDPPRYRPLFPVCERRVYLDHAGVSPCSTRVRDAVDGWIGDLVGNGMVSGSAWEDAIEAVREKAARLLGATPAEITFVRSTSTARPGSKLRVRGSKFRTW